MCKNEHSRIKDNQIKIRIVKIVKIEKLIDHNVSRENNAITYRDSKEYCKLSEFDLFNPPKLP